jgi:PIN domain nuclease of toxin-antitoxin system
VTGFLLDTNVVLWMLTGGSRLNSTAKARLDSEQRFVSVISFAEIAIKASLGKLPLPPPFTTDFGGALRAALAFVAADILLVDLEAVEHLRQLPFHHRDPFDRMIIAQAFAGGLTVVTGDRAFDAYDGLPLLKV